MSNDFLSYTIAGIDGGNPILDFGQLQVNMFTMPYLLQIYFTEAFPGEPDRLEPVWGFSVSNFDPAKIPSFKTVTYGQLPAGYELLKAAEPLETGSYYYVGVSKQILHKIDEGRFEAISVDEFAKLPKPAVPKEPRVVEDFAPAAGFDADDDAEFGGGENSDYHSIDKSVASARALEIMKDEYFWSCADESAPFGSDEGADLYDQYMRCAESLENPDGVEFLEMMCESWDMQPGSLADLEVTAADDPSALPAAVREEAAAFRESIPSIDSMDTQMAALGMPPAVLEMMKNTGAMNDVLVGNDVRDLFAMALAFAQLVRFGAVQPRVLDYALMAAKVRLRPRPKDKQADPIMIKRYQQWQSIFQRLKSEMS